MHEVHFLHIVLIIYIIIERFDCKGHDQLYSKDEFPINFD